MTADNVIRFFIIALFLLPAFAFGQVYKCVNDGKTSYLQTPCLYGSVDYVQPRDNVQLSFFRSLARGVDGRFTALGNVNGMPVKFIIDTGATSSVISGRAAFSLGIKNCLAAGTAQTAGGGSTYCISTFRLVSVSGFDFVNVPLMIIPAMTGDDALIGMDLLSRLKFTQQNGIITLSR